MPHGTRKRLRHFGRFFTQPSEEMASLSLRMSREALGGLPPNMTVAERDELLATKTRLEADSQVSAARIRELESQNQALNKLLQHVGIQRSYALVVCEVIRCPRGKQSEQVVVIDCGSSSGVQPGQAVMSLDGVVGVVSEATTRQAVVELYSSQTFSLPCEVAGRRLSAVLENHSGQLVLDSALGADYDAAEIGDQVLTTDLGEDAMQPGLLLGTIAEKSRDENGAPLYAVTPVASPDTLKYLMVVLAKRQ
ncbi:MAG: rod shape-determining protein MreC [Victivallales bacterium]|nr:rod shape-determining protein MreC [Victivallales bacterium]